MPTLAQVIAKINNDITENGNEEITGLVLNSVLLDIVAQINDLVGKLEGLSTDDVTSIVNAINSLKQELDDYINSQVGALTGNDDPNETQPIGFNGRVGTIYLKMTTIGVQTTPESYWIYTGINDIGWLNLTADDTFKMVVVDHYADLPAQGQTNRIYFVQDENNTYIWNVNIFPNDYVLVGGVIEGEFIDDTTFNDEFGSPVVPDTGNLYLDTITGKYYRWDGNYFLAIDQDTGGGGTDFSDLSNNVIPKKSPSDNALEDSNITDTATGVSVGGRTDTDLVIEKAVNATGITTAYAIDLGAGAGNFNLTLSGATDFTFSNMIEETQSCVFTIIVLNTGENAFQFPIWLKEDPDGDEASTLDRIVVHIHKGGVSPDGTYHIKNL